MEVRKLLGRRLELGWGVRSASTERLDCRGFSARILHVGIKMLEVAVVQIDAGLGPQVSYTWQRLAGFTAQLV